MERKIGNFILRTEEKDGVQTLLVKSVDSSWHIQWSEVSAMYSNLMFVLQVAAEEQIIEEYLERLLVSFYAHTNHVHDWNVICKGGIKNESGEVEFLPFLSKYFKMCEEAVQRDISLEEEIDAKSDAEALEEVGDLEAISDSLDDLDCKKNE